MDFEQWKQSVVDYADRELDMDDAAIDWEAWKDYYDEGLSAAEAWQAEFNAST